MCTSEPSTHLLSEVVQELAVLLPHGNTKLEVLQSSKRSQKLGTELVRPLVQEVKLAPRAPRRAVERGVV